MTTALQVSGEMFAGSARPRIDHFVRAATLPVLLDEADRVP